MMNADQAKQQGLGVKANHQSAITAFWFCFHPLASALICGKKENLVSKTVVAERRKMVLKLHSKLALLGLMLLLSVVLLCSSLPSSAMGCFFVELGGVVGVAPEVVGRHGYFISKAGHVGAYMLLTLLACRAVKPFWAGVGLVILVGLGTEFLQVLLPSRSARFSDFGFDVFGLGLGSLLLLLARRELKPEAVAVNDH